ncbi:MAG: hypothetical protein NTV59_07200 [Chloroflexi bacterium]|nr:hypothetical protein [Chloroflexota bacterium]
MLAVNLWQLDLWQLDLGALSIFGRDVKIASMLLLRKQSKILR